MKYDFDPNLPIYLQVMAQIKKDIFCKISLPGDKIDSVRELAIKYSVNPNTIQKALGELEREGLLYSERAVGRYVTKDGKMIAAKKKEMSETIVQDFVNEMKGIGYSVEEILAIIKDIEIK